MKLSNFYNDLVKKENEIESLYNDIVDQNAGKFNEIINQPNEWGVSKTYKQMAYRLLIILILNHKSS